MDLDRYDLEDPFIDEGITYMSEDEAIGNLPAEEEVVAGSSSSSSEEDASSESDHVSAPPRVIRTRYLLSHRSFIS